MARFRFLRQQKPTAPKAPLPAFILWPIVLIGNPANLPLQPQGAMAQLLKHFELEAVEGIPPVVAKFVAIIQSGNGELNQIKQILTGLVEKGLMDRDIANLLYAVAYFKQHQRPPAGSAFDESGFNLAQLARESNIFGPQPAGFPDFGSEQSQFDWPDGEWPPRSPRPQPRHWTTPTGQARPAPRRSHQARTPTGHALRVVPPEEHDERVVDDESPSGPLVPPHPEGKIYLFRRDWSWITANDRFFVAFGIVLWILVTMAISAIVTVPNWIEQVPIFLLAASGLIILLALRIAYWRADMIRVDTGTGILEYQRRPQWWNPVSRISERTGTLSEARRCQVEMSGSWSFAAIGKLRLVMMGKDIQIEGLRQPELVRDFIGEWTKGVNIEELNRLYRKWQTTPSPLDKSARAILRFLWNCRQMPILPFRDARTILKSGNSVRAGESAKETLRQTTVPLFSLLGLLFALGWALTQTEVIKWVPAAVIGIIYLVRAQRYVSFQMLPAVFPDEFAGEQVVDDGLRIKPSLATSTTTTPTLSLLEWERFEGVPKRAGVVVRCAVCSRILDGALERPPRVYPAVLIKYGDWTVTVYFHDFDEQIRVAAALRTQDWPAVFRLLKNVRWPNEFLALASTKE